VTQDGITHDPLTGSTTFTGKQAIDLFRSIVIASGAALYLNTGMKPNRAYTPTRMRNALNELTGSNAKTLKGALTAYVDALEAQGTPCTNQTVLRAVGR